jgi:predicted nucleic acid-binding Zn ribbon protein
MANNEDASNSKNEKEILTRVQRLVRNTVVFFSLILSLVRLVDIS